MKVTTQAAMKVYIIHNASINEDSENGKKTDEDED